MKENLKMCFILEKLHAFFHLGKKKAQNNDSSYYDVCMNFAWKNSQNNLMDKTKPNPAASVAIK